MRGDKSPLRRNSSVYIGGPLGLNDMPPAPTAAKTSARSVRTAEPFCRPPNAAPPRPGTTAARPARLRPALCGPSPKLTEKSSAPSDPDGRPGLSRISTENPSVGGRRIDQPGGSEKSVTGPSLADSAVTSQIHIQNRLFRRARSSLDRSYRVVHM